MADDANTEPTNAEETQVVEAEDMFDAPTPDAAEKPANEAGTTEPEGDEPAPAKDDDTTPDSPVEGEEDKPDAEEPDKKPDDAEEEEDPKERARREYRERQQRRSLDSHVADVERAELKAQEELDPDDPDYRLQKLESDSRIREAREIAREIQANQQALNADGDSVRQNIPMFNPDDKENFNQVAFDAAEQEFINTYIVTSEEEDPNDREILGAFDPRTGKPVSYYQFMKAKAEQFAKIAGTRAQKAAQDTRVAERRMRGAAEPTSGGSAPKKETAEDREAREMADAFK